MSDRASLWQFRARLALERLKLAVSENLLRLRGVKGQV